MRTDPLIFLTHLRVQPWFLLPPLLMILLSLLLGRFFCGWICPLGTLIEGLDLLLGWGRRLKASRNLNSPRRPGVKGMRYWLIRYPPALVILGAVLVTCFSAPPLVQFFHPNIWIIRLFALTLPGIFFLALLLVFSALTRRLWCKYLCPLGAFYGLLARLAPFKLRIEACSGCGRCDGCPMEAADYTQRRILPGQCILCFDYERNCPVEGFSYHWTDRQRAQGADQHQRTDRLPTPKAVQPAQAPTPEERVPDLPRRRFLKQGTLLLGGGVVGGLLSCLDRPAETKLLRPPGVVREAEFIQRCLRCLQCVRSCPNQIIKATGFGVGPDSLFTPQLDFSVQGCDYYCQVCQIVCPNGAIPLQDLTQKQKTRIGKAVIDEERCVVYAEGINCIVCEEMCPVPQKAIILRQEGGLQYPLVVSRCIGCGICEAYCPVEPKAIIIQSRFGP